ncbi:MAG: hypothetical protein ACJASG_002200 [Oleiphilaceae bacterium]
MKLQSQQKLKEQLTVERIIHRGLRKDAYGDGMKSLLPFGSGEGLTLEKVKQHKHGLELGPLEPRLPKKLYTKDKKVQLFPGPMLADMARLQVFAAQQSSGSELLLIGRRDL